jgi:hypothetical protein
MSKPRNLFLDRVNEFHEKGLLPDHVMKVFYDKLPMLERAVSSVERASGIDYPAISFEPTLSIIKYPSATFSRAIIYASTRIKKLNGNYALCVEMSLPFLFSAREDMLRACIAHEFLHYVFNTIAIAGKAFATLSGERLDTPEVHIAYDDTHIVEPEEWLADQQLIDLIKKHINPVIADRELETEIKSKWIDAGLPVTHMTVEASRFSIPILEISKIPLDQKIIRKGQTKRFFLHVGH